MNNPDPKIEIHGIKGMASKAFRKTFKNQAAFEAWYDKNEGDFEIYGMRDIEA